MADKYISTKKVFDAVTVLASGNTTSEVIDLNKYKPEGFFSLQITLTDAGTGKFTFLTSNDGIDYYTPTGSSDIVAAHTVASGPATDGKDTYIVDTPFLVRYLKIKVEETSTTDPIIVTATLAIQ